MLRFRHISILTALLFLALAALWMCVPAAILTGWGVEFSDSTGLVSRRAAALYAGIGVMFLAARNAEPSQGRTSLVAGSKSATSATRRPPQKSNSMSARLRDERANSRRFLVSGGRYTVMKMLAATQGLGLFKGKAYPWSVCIDELEVITRFVGSPDAFLYYIERRTAHQSSEVSFSGDELDIFGQYLDSRLHPSVYESNPEFSDHHGSKMVGFSDGQERFEKVYFSEWENEPKTEADPGLQLPPGIEPLLQELRRREDDGARWIAFSLLGFSNTALRRLAAAVDDVRGAQCEGTRIQRITTREDDIVINVMAHAGLDTKGFYQNTLMRTRLEHYRARPRATFTLGIDQRNRAEAFETASWIEGPWQKEDVMERLLAEDREAPRRMQLYRSTKKPGRNDPCPCNSGKKFKRCCLDKISFESRK